MKVAAGSELKARLSYYLSEVREGGEVVVTARGKAVARLVAAAAPADEGEERLSRLEARGLVRRGSGKLGADFWDLPRPEDPEARALKAILRERSSSK